ncbi:uncharacterized protein G2W53_028092 [Senna tora]|uniref:Uncharacterized protein n=1 Tax=Senna tora TaxID=362788 RepID=A0A834T2R1_9FABA|nr:uncharacterized protein G2W53_028092 [Senna tora]
MGVGWWDEIEDEEETVHPNHDESSENSIFRFLFGASQPMELFGSIVSLCAVLEIVFWIIPADHTKGMFGNPPIESKTFIFLRNRFTEAFASSQG